MRLSFGDDRKDLITTPGHRFLTETGDYMEIGHMVRLGGGQVRLVGKDGSIVEARGELLTYSAETAELFAQSEARSVAYGGGSTAVQYDSQQGWATYNFTVAKTHTYIADNDNSIQVLAA